ncbi:SAM-dependent methyltransferase, MidA family [Paenibacillus sp. yr247]|uniref:class I SAM-dependent methyltransferase n=1 Tax=Paenibacillus sp. yr247 TaxID=1761880 RepID=UPI000886C5BE|nr:SAM-dependent methyltransferase [Paenibacillus sp. yr247]SDM89919.1 SAM-dependent methyltransferase, MidA family [Paenibacillus sp. yr247]
MNNQLGHPDVVKALIKAIQLEENKAITFRDYMDICLYSEPQGYYRNESPKIGKQGDFYTSSSVGSVMGEMVAAYICAQLHNEIPNMEPIHIVEWGGGNGRLALHLIDEMKRIAPAIYARLTYTIIESSAYHRGLQRAALEEHAQITQFTSEAEWFAEMPQAHVFVLANELLDAFPVHRIRYKDLLFNESYVTWQEEEQIFQEIWLPISSKRILDCIRRSKVQWSDGQIGEINLDAEEWFSHVSKRIYSGSCIVIDYGDIEKELYASHRYNGTLMCYRKHQAHDNPWIHQGEQDMTSHVNFSSCQTAAHESGFSFCKLQTQREFLVEQGILQRLQNHFDPNPFSDVSKRNRAIRQLLISDQMSELFKVFIATKD